MRRKFLVATLGLLALGSTSQAQVTFFEDFEGGFLPTNWLQQNNSVSPGTPWTQANRTTAISGLQSQYANANFGSTTVTTPTGGDISNWLITPLLTLSDGDQVSFWTASAGDFADRLEVRWATSGSSVGSTFSDVGDFMTVLTTINPTLDPNGYPTTWTNVAIPIAGIGSNVSGRLAFRYFVPDGGINGNNSNGIGIDGVTVMVAPEPVSGALTLLTLPLAVLLRRKKSA